jgi:uncharacterized membrane protein
MHATTEGCKRHLWIAMLVAALAAFLVVAPGAASRAGPAFTTIDLPGATMTHGYAINARGDVAGSYVAGGKTYGFVLEKDGSLTTIDYPGAAWTEAWGVNARGDVVGRYGLAGRIHGFVLRDGELSDISVPGEDHTMPTGIGDDGTIVGCYHSTGFTYMYGYSQKGGEITRFLEVEQSMHNGVAVAGTLIAGLRVTAAGQRAYLVDGGQVTHLDVPGAAQAAAMDVNARGEVVGIFSPGAGIKGWVLSRGEYAVIEAPGATTTWAYGINASGQVVGTYTDASGGMHGYVLNR